MHAPLPLTPVRTLATAASVLVGVVCAANVYGSWAAWNAHSVVEDYVADLPGVTGEDLYAADSVTTRAAVVSVLTIVAAASVFLTWLWRARVNAENISTLRHRMSRGWTIGAWFCPVVNLWFPRRIVDDIWRASRPDVTMDQRSIDEVPLSPLVRGWWLVLMGNYALTFLLRAQSTASGVTVGSFETIAIYSTVGTLLVIVAGILLIKVIRQITEWQSTPRTTLDEAAHQQVPLT